MQATLTFNLPEEQDEFNYCLSGNKYHTVLFNLRNQFSRWNKQDKEPTYDDIKKAFYEMLSDINYE